MSAEITRRRASSISFMERRKRPPTASISALLARLERGRVEAREQLAVGGEGVRKVLAAFHAVADVGQHGAEMRLPHALEHEVESLQQRQAGLEQRRQLLVPHHEVLVRYALAPSAPGRASEPARQPAAAHLEDVVAALAQLGEQRRLVAGDERLFEDAAFRRSHSANELHRRCSLSLSPRYSGRFWASPRCKVKTMMSASRLASPRARPRLKVCSSQRLRLVWIIGTLAARWASRRPTSKPPSLTRRSAISVPRRKLTS